MLPYLEARLRGQISRWPHAEDWLALQAVESREELEKVLQSQSFAKILPHGSWLSLPEKSAFLRSEALWASQWQNLWQRQVQQSFSLFPKKLFETLPAALWPARQAQIMAWADFFYEKQDVEKEVFKKQWLNLWPVGALPKRLLALWWPLWAGQLPMTQWQDFEGYFFEALGQALRILHISSGKPVLVLAYFVALSLLWYRLRGQILRLEGFADLRL